MIFSLKKLMYPISQNISRSYIIKVLTLIFFSFSLQAQLISPLEDRASCNFSDLEEERLDNLLTNDAVERFSLVIINDPFEENPSGKLSFKIPGVEANYTALAIDRDYEDSNNYTWSGNLVGQEGHIILVTKNGYTGGIIQITNEAFYSIAPISIGKSALLKIDQTNFVLPSVDVTEGNTQENDFDVCETDNENCFENPQEITVMVLIPNEVSDYLGGNTLAAAIYVGIGIESTNVALANSGITNVNIDWFTEPIDFEFNQRPDIRKDQEKLIVNEDIQEKRQDKKADLVVLFSNQNYMVTRDDPATPDIIETVPVYGSSGTIGPNKTRAYAIVEVSQILGPQYTFAHEIGHLLGARHEDDNADDCCHAGLAEDGRFATLMYVGNTGNSSRKLIFSSKAPRENNTLCIRNSACEVANYFVTDFTAYIKANQGCHKEDQDNTYTVVVTSQSSGQSPFNYSWTWKTGRMRYPLGDQRTSDKLPDEANGLENSPVLIEVEVTSIPTGVTKAFRYTSNHCDDPPPAICPDITATFTPNDLPDCPSGTNGNLTVTPEGGTPPYEYAWSTGENTATVNNLSEGTYTVVVTDANGCSSFLTYELNGENTEVSITPRSRDTDCNASNGNVRLTVQGNSGPYSYQWSNSSTSKNIFGLPPGTYTVTVTDDNGCVAIRTYEIGQRNAPELDLDITDTNCNDDNGAIDLSITGGRAPYTIQWDNDCGPEDEEDISNLAAGTYSVTVTDDRGCIVTASGVVEKSSRIRIVARASEASFGQSDGSIDVSVKGGTPPYEYDWGIDGTGDFDDPEDLSSVGAGTYTLVVRDAAGCTKEEVVTIRNPKSGSITLESSVTTTDCNSGTNAILMSVTGGTAPYTYYWKELNDAQESQATSNDATYTIQNLGAGTYDLRVVDTESLEASDQIEVTDRGMEIIGVSASDATCGAISGIVSLTISGGTPPYVYSDGTNSYTSNNPYRTFSLPIGTYDLSATDANGCSVNTTGELYGSEADPLVLDQLEISGADCGSIFGGSSSGDGGKIHILLDGGTPSFSYTIQNQFTLSTETENSSSNVQIFGGLTAATYGITITDGEGCNITTTATVGSGEDNCFPDFCLSGNCDDTYDGLLAKGPSQAACSSGRDDLAHYCSGGGYININVTGGTAPYSYEWTRSGGGTTEVVTTTEDLNTGIAGSYSVKVTDAANSIQNLGPWNLYDPLSVNISCFPRNDNPNRFNVNANANGGSQCKVYTWFKNGVQVSDGDNDFSLKNQPAGTYEVLVEDVRTGCSVSSTSVTCNSSSLPSIQNANFQTFTNLEVTAAPNPFQSHFNLDISTDQEQTILIHIYDLKGRSVYNRKVNAVAGKQQVRVDLQQQNGVYQVVIIGAQQEMKTFRVVQME